MKTQHIALAIALLISTSFVSIAQTTGQKIGENPTIKNPGAILDLESTNKGVLFPRVALSNTTTWGLAGTATRGMLIYNTKTTTDGFTGTTAYPVATGDGTGVYFWDGTGWAAAAKVSGGDPTKDAWIDDPTNTQVKLGTLSDGTTARTDDKAFVAKDDGNVGIGLTNPAGKLDIKGKMYVNNQQTVYNAGALNPDFAGSLFIGNGGNNLLHTSTTDGQANTSVGFNSLIANTIGNSNTATGAYALGENTIGVRNSALGYRALYASKAGSNGVAIGNESQRYANNTLTAWENYNTSVGNSALRGSTTAANNTGNFNTAIGAYSLFNTTTGKDNTGVGLNTLYNTSSGISNVAIGTAALLNNTTGDFNVSMGINSLLNSQTGDLNTALGYRSGLGITTGENNTLVGGLAGSTNSIGITTGSNNTIMGANLTGLPAALNNNIILADGSGNQRIRVLANGNTGIGTTTPQKKLHVAGSLQITNELNVGGDATTAGSAGTAGQYLTSNGPGVAPTWQAPAGIVPTSNGTVIAINGKLQIAQEIIVQLLADFATTSSSETQIGNLTTEIIDNEDTYTANTTSNSFTVKEDGVYQVIMNMQLAATEGSIPAIGIWDNTTGKWVARVNDKLGSTLQTFTLITSIDMLAANTYSFRVASHTGTTTIKAESTGTTGSGPVSQVSIKRLK